MFHDTNSNFHAVTKIVSGIVSFVLTSICWTDINGGFNYLDLKVTSEESAHLRECLMGLFQFSMLPKMALWAPVFLEFNITMHFYFDNTKCQKLPLVPFSKSK